MQRDTYHDFVTDEELQDSAPGLSGGLLRDVYFRLRGRSGAHNVTNGIFRRVYDPSLMATRLSVSFDSRAWTGLV